MQSLLLLHGALGSSSQLKILVECLSAKYEVYAFDFAGHGGKEGNDLPLTIINFANEVLAFMDQEKLEKVSIFGYSMGGYVGMYLAKNHREKVEKIITLATKYYWDEATAAKEVQMLNPEKIEQKVPAFAEALKKMHMSVDWKQLMKQTAEMMIALGKDSPLKLADYSSITTPAMLLLGDRDKMVTLDETLAVYRALPNARLGVLPGTPHSVEQVDMELLSFFIKQFLA